MSSKCMDKFNCHIPKKLLQAWLLRLLIKDGQYVRNWDSIQCYLHCVQRKFLSYLKKYGQYLYSAYIFKL